MDTVEAPRLLALRAVTDRTSLSRMSILRAVARGDFPRPLRLSSQRIAWRESDVADWINSRTPVVA
jgi:prophage regulatory protein